MGKLSNNQKVKVFKKALNMIMYIPVEAATYGGTPIPIKTGLKTIPPPRPTALAKPPPIDPSASYTICLPLNDTSDLHNPILVDFLISSSLYSLRIWDKEISAVMTRKVVKIIQSRALHFCILIIDGFFFDPLIRLTINASPRVTEQSK
jgi:hypothetical protein